MQTFLNKVAQHIEQNYKEKLDELCIVLPNKRGALFLKHQLAKVYEKTIWLPAIISSEDLVSEFSGLQNLEDIDLICRLYESYKFIYSDKAESFDSFAKWGHLILQDFNEIDRYLVDAPQLYNNLSSIKEIENWSLAGEELSEFQKNYLEFMKHLGGIYSHFTNSLLKNNDSYQGLSYKEAVKKFEVSPFVNRFHKIIFCGFNALNKAETIIFSKLVSSGKAEIIWDADKYYLEDRVKEAGLFLRRNFKTFANNEPQFIGEHFKENKFFEIVSVPKQIGQAQCVANILNNLLEKGTAPDSIAVVLANEKLLWPVLKLLPEQIEHVNITMEYPLKYTSAYSGIDLLLKVHLGFETQQKKQKHIYYTDFLNLLRHSFFQEYLNAIGLQNTNTAIINKIMDRNYAFITHALLKELYGDSYVLLQELLEPWQNAKQTARSISVFIQTVKEFHLSGELNNYKSIELEYLNVLIKNFNRVKELIEHYNYFETLKSFKIIFNQIVGASSAAFIGEPLRGLQIMGVLETRTLDFENIILVSVNEGVLPSGKSMNSFIPNDLKRYFGMPLYGDKDAIYAYHFYRLLQRAKNTFITFDSETDTFGKGEKSRFVSQLELEMADYNKHCIIKESVAASTQFFENKIPEIKVDKNKDALELILNKAISSEEYFGLSPSSLITFKECSLKFYFRYGVGLKEPASLEESAEANTFGSILHESLENLYQPFVGKNISAGDLRIMESKVSESVETNFLNYFTKTEAFFGKNLLQQSVLKEYVKKLLENDIDFVNDLYKNELFIIALEKEMVADIFVKINNIPTKIFIKGKADRIDRVGDTIRIIDYKSSIHNTDKFKFTDFEDLFCDIEYNKMFQLFLYAWLAFKNKIAIPEQMNPCIIAFKKFEKEPKYISSEKAPLVFTEELLKQFENRLVSFIEKLFDEKIAFTQTEDKDVCKFCAYNAICIKESDF